MDLYSNSETQTKLIIYIQNIHWGFSIRISMII